MNKYLISGLIIISFVLEGYSQSYSNKRVMHFNYADSVVVDSLSIVPGSVFLFGNEEVEVSSDKYWVDYSGSVLYFQGKDSLPDKFTLFYRVFPYSFTGVYQPIVPVYDTVTKEVVSDVQSVFYETSSFEEEEVAKINVTGNISRGITTGNGQNMVMNSNLNLQLSGNIDDNVQIEAYMSDKNVPIQPDGYSQQINQFDQIYMRLYDSTKYLQVGDVDINGSNSYFLKFQRRLLGGDFAGIFYSENGVETYAQASAAIAKGTFNRQEIQGIEGVQGPYSLQGANSERYVVVLAGSERVYIDGILLTRGENADYVIDYNTAEVTFMPRTMITKDSRIIAEFEYSDKKYNRFLLYGQTGVKYKKSEFNVQYFSEGDSKSQPVEQELSPEHKEILENSGDNIYDAVVPNFDSVGYSNDRVLYMLIDTVVNSELYDSVFVVSYNEDLAHYRVGFSAVGEGKGNYVQDISNANGRVYKWVAPVNGLPQGNYAPLQLLVAPKRKQVIVLSAKQGIGEMSEVSAEVAFSNNDLNTFSEKDSHDDKGIAVTTGAERNFDFGSRKMKVYGKYDFIHKYFSTPERFRSAEFKRDWNFDLVGGEDQQFVEGGVVFYKKKKENLNLSVQHLEQVSLYKGTRLNGNVNLGNSKSLLYSSNSYLLSNDTSKRTSFYRHNVGYAHFFGKLKAGGVHGMEYNVVRAVESDTLLASSIGFSKFDVFLASGDSTTNSFELKYRNRMDLYPRGDELKNLSTADEYIGSLGIGNMSKHRFDGTVIYRDLNVKDSALSAKQKGDNNFLGRVEHRIKLFKRAASFTTFYEVGSGMEAKKEYVYVEVPMGQGVYVWIDYNENGIPELNEFERAKFANEANYIRVYTPTNDYIHVYMLKFNETFKVDLSRMWRNESGLKGALARLSNSTSFRMQQKQTSDDIGRRLNPFAGQISDSTLISESASWRNSFSFNRRGTVFGADYIYLNSSNKSLLNNGFESSQRQKHEVKLRWNIIESILFQPSVSLAEKTYSSEFFSSRNYIINETGVQNVLQWQPGTKFRVRLLYNYTDNYDDISKEVSVVQEIGSDLKINSPGKGSVTAQFMAVNTTFSGDNSSTLSYEMLNGYMPGMNYRWMANVSRNLNKFLRLTILYNGRAGTDMETIHTGQLNLVAFF